MAEFVRVTDTDGRSHVVACAEIVRVQQASRPDGRSFTPGAVVWLRNGARIALYEPERAALEKALLAPQEESHGP